MRVLWFYCVDKYLCLIKNSLIEQWSLLVIPLKTPEGDISTYS